MYRQGDVLLKRIENLPIDCVAAQGPVVLALGETTGHSHRFRDGSGVCGFFKAGAEDHTISGGGSVLVGEKTDVSFVTIPQGGADLLHVGEEPHGHDAIPIPPGNYEVVRQREYVGPGIARRVVD